MLWYKVLQAMQKEMSACIKTVLFFAGQLDY